MGGADLKTNSRPRSLSGVIQTKRSSLGCCISATSVKKFFPDRKACTNIKRSKCDRSLLLGIKRTSSDINFNLENNWVPSRIELDLSSSYKRKRLNDDSSVLKESQAGRGGRPSNAAMIKAIDSDDAMDYLRVRKQKGETKLNIKQAKVFDRMVDSEKSCGPKPDNFELQQDPF